MATSKQSDAVVQQALRDLEVTANSFALRLIKMAGVRSAYLREIKEMSASTWAAYKNNELSAKAAAEIANSMRNQILDMSRANDMDLGRAYAQGLKKRGLNLDQVITYIMNEKEGFKERFAGKKLNALTNAEQTEIFEEVVKSAGRDRPKVTAAIPRLRWAARGLWFVTASVAIYNIGTSQNPWWQTGREGANIGGGVLGGMAGGAAMGAAGGVWAGPIGVGVGIIVGGILGALLADRVYVEAAGTSDVLTRGFVARFTSVWKGTDEAAMAEALAREHASQPDFVLRVFRSLEQDYSTDSDDVAYEYVTRIRKNQALARTVKGNRILRDYLINLMESGWTSNEEAQAVAWLKTP